MRRLIGGEFEGRANIPGGEFLGDLLPPGKPVSLWAGASSALRVLFRELGLRPGDRVLFPSYLCPSILAPFRQAGVIPDFYRVGGDLVIDTGDLDRRLKEGSGPKAVFFIQYFGFLQPPGVLAYLREAGRRGFVTIEDGVQSLLSGGVFETGHWGLASLRKWLYIDAGVLVGDLSKFPEESAGVQGYSLYRLYKDLGIRAREIYLAGGPGFFEKFYLNMLKKAEKCYSSYITCKKLSYSDRRKLDRGIGWSGIKSLRRENFLLLERLLEGCRQAVPLFSLDSPDICPLGYPVRVGDGLRDQLRGHLARQGIFCPVHWDLGGVVPSRFEESIKLSGEILTIPLDQRYNEEDMEYTAGQVIRFFK